ncbi:hypothetical protein B0A55_09312 [Friedmanniomyces simplex]|uniref:Xaa-Pro dipeptidyl-peptidase C-terminal domain-containing protein n=1 Tax=Friedmanniomyces simplex TaxID=329884 RepID=A0A4U0WNP9_9PEZI|nr:hypothetical protein B0A55_09312 [Friedmanniomyces simplex]
MGSIAPPLIRLERLSFVIYEHPDLDAFRSYAKDFGLEEASSSSNEVFFAGYGRDPFVYIARAADPGSGKRFVGAGFCAETEDDFKKASGRHGAQQVNTANRPGGGQAVSITDLNGFVVEVCWGQKEKKLPPHGVSSVVEGGVVNGALNKARVGEFTRMQEGPAAVHKLGHFGYNTDKFEETCEWYTKNFNIYPTDVLWAPSDKNLDVAAFYRLDRGKEFVDHHCLLIARGEKGEDAPNTTVHHSSFEVEDLDTQMMGHQHLLDAGHKLLWGIGRHVHGSQPSPDWLFVHFIVEHYADGDVVNDELPTAKFEAGHMAVWDRSSIDADSFDYIFEQNVNVPLKCQAGTIRANVYRPKTSTATRFPVLVTYGPYGKDVPYSRFHPNSFAELDEEQKSPHSAWETPDPGFWTRHGYAIVRADEVGLGQSPGFMDTMSRSTSQCFADLIEWAADSDRAWSNGKFGLLGVSYYAGRDRAPGELEASRNDQRLDNERYAFYDHEYYASRDYNMSDIKVPLLSVGNWGGIALHLRGNVEGYINAGSAVKYLRLITGRHDLPFYGKEGVEMQLSFLNAFLKGIDDQGWTTGKASTVAYKIRKGNPGYNTPQAESSFEWRTQPAWPIPGTAYTRYWLTSSGGLQRNDHEELRTAAKLSYKTLGTLADPQLLEFSTPPFTQATEITGHVTARLSVSATREDSQDLTPMDMDVFVTLRHIVRSGEEALHTGTVGDPNNAKAVPIVKGWLRVSLRQTNPDDPRHQAWHPHQIWPTNVIVEEGGRLKLEVASGDTQGVGLFRHDSSADRPAQRFAGMNHIHFEDGLENWLLLPEVGSS